MTTTTTSVPENEECIEGEGQCGPGYCCCEAPWGYHLCVDRVICDGDVPPFVGCTD